MTPLAPSAPCVVAPDREITVLIRRIRFWLVVMIAGLVFSGITAFPLACELRSAAQALHDDLLRRRTG
jgi:hypothetical protein